MDEPTPTQNPPAQESPRELITFLTVALAIVVLGIVIGALAGSEPTPSLEATPTTAISVEDR